MRKSLLIVAALLLVSGIAMAHDVYGTTGTPASHVVTVNVTIPPRVGIRIDDAEAVKALDLTGDATYPPAVPTYWTIGTTNLISILSTGNYSYAYTTDGTGLSAGLTVGEFEYQTTGWGAGTWGALGAGTLEPNPTPRTAGWASRNMNYRVSLAGHETAGVNTLLITYTITAQP
jgi:hypothetical protein